MYSVILTELGIIVSDTNKVTKTFPFSDTVGQYLAIKNKEGAPNELSRYLEELQIGFTVNDESLLFILKKKEIDVQLMSESEMEEIQSIKPQLLIDADLAKDPQDALGKLRDFAIALSSSKVTKVSESPDLHVIQAINSLDEIDKIANALSSRLREWYGLHFPELENLIDSINGYSQIVMAGKREKLTKQVFADAGFPESKVEMLELIQQKSRGGDISEENLIIVQGLAKQIIEMHTLRKNLEDHLETQMGVVAPNLSAILGNAVGARLLARAGSLQKLASMPASTIQILGAEKALFRALKTGSQPPKHGLLFQHAMVHSAPRWQRGKIARAVAAKAAIAARVDVYGAGINETLLEKLNVRVQEIGEKYSEPVQREPKKFEDSRSRDRGRDGGDRRSRDSRYSRDDRRSRDRDGGDRYSRREGRDRDGGDRRSRDRDGGDRYSRREGRDRDSNRRPMFSATCDECGADCELPFRPNQNKPVFCNNCFSKSSPRDNYSRGDRQYRGERGDRQYRGESEEGGNSNDYGGNSNNNRSGGYNNNRSRDKFSRDRGRPKGKGNSRKRFGRR